MKTINKNKLPQLLTQLTQQYLVFVPAKSDGISQFMFYGPELDLYWQKNVDLPPKDIFFPQTEKMYRFETMQKSLTIEKIQTKELPQIIFGIRSCDLKGIECFDQVFLTGGYVDQFYQEKRERTILIALACSQAEEYCFCTSMGVNPQKGENADIQTFDLGNELAFQGLTQRGRNLLKQISNLLIEKEVAIPDFQECSTNIDLNGVPEKLKNMFEHPLWEDLSRKCLNCAICTYVCPTCHCFDIAAVDGMKIRCWDSCMFDEFTAMAGGHQPRPGKKERVRNRFMHKLRYFPERYEMLLCTGCGRCRVQCPVNLDIVDIIKQIQKEVVESGPIGASGS